MSALDQKLNLIFEKITHELVSHLGVKPMRPPKFIVLNSQARSFVHSVAFNIDEYTAKITVSQYYWDKMIPYQRKEMMVHAVAQIAVQIYFKGGEERKPHGPQWRFIMSRMGYIPRVEFEGMVDV